MEKNIQKKENSKLLKRIFIISLLLIAAAFLGYFSFIISFFGNPWPAILLFITFIIVSFIILRKI